MMRVVVLDDYQGVAHRYGPWDSLGPSVTVDFVDSHLTGEELIGRLAGAEVAVAMRERTAFDAALFAALPHLRLLVTTGPFNAVIDLVAAAAAGVTVCGTGGLATPTAELTWGLVLALARHLPAEDAAVRRGEWQRNVGTELAGKTFGVMGLGRLGSQVAKVGLAFGMRVVAWSQNLDAARAASMGVEPVTRQTLLAESDVVSLHLKLSPRTEGIVGAAELALMRPTAYLVNTSRGPLVDNVALVAALVAGRLAGAAIDVYEVEPLPAGDLLRTAPNLLLTPHVGYVTAGTYEIFYGDAVADIAAWLAGAPLREITA